MKYSCQECSKEIKNKNQILCTQCYLKRSVKRTYTDQELELINWCLAYVLEERTTKILPFYESIHTKITNGQVDNDLIEAMKTMKRLILTERKYEKKMS